MPTSECKIGSARIAGFAVALLAANPVLGIESVKLLYDCVSDAPVSSNFFVIGTWGEDLVLRSNTRGFGVRYLQSDGTPQGTVPIEASNTSATITSILGPNGNSQFVTALFPNFGSELSLFDPETQVITLVRDLEPGSDSPLVEAFTIAGDRNYFLATTTSNGREFWQTDGTELGTNIVAEVFPGPTGIAFSSVVMGGHPLGNRLFFYLNDISHGLEPWLIDGAAGQVRLIRDIFPGGTGSLDDSGLVPVRILSLGHHVIFTARSSVSNRQIWSTDGSAENTVALTNSTASSGISTNVLFSWRGAAIFNGRLSDAGPLQWFRTDGTVGGTQPLVLPPPLDSALNVQIFGFGDDLAVRAELEGVTELWVTDLTSSNTRRLVSGVNSTVTFAEGGILPNGLRYFCVARPDSGPELWVSDGTESGTQMVTHISDGQYGGIALAVDNQIQSYIDSGILGENLYFRATTLQAGTEVWRYNWISGDSQLFLDYTPGHGINPQRLTAAGDRLFCFGSTLQTGSELWTSDGTPEGTYLPVELVPGTGGTTGFSNQPLAFGNMLIGRPSGPPSVRGVWRFDGTPAGTYVLMSTPQGNPYLLGTTNTHAYFTASVTAGFERIWETDGTVAGTRSIHEFQQNRNVDNGRAIVVKEGALANNLFFAANLGAEGSELWRMNLLTRELSLVKDINPGAVSSSPGQMQVVGDRIFFVAFVSTIGLELWVTDGTTDGTQLTRDIRAGMSPSLPTRITPLGRQVVFQADDGIHGPELWVSDGSEAGTSIIADLFPGSQGALNGNVEGCGDFVFFSAETPETGNELWITDGTPQGTRLIRDLTVGSESSAIGSLVCLEDVAYFSMSDSAFGRELWRSDGTDSGTFRVADIVPGPGSSLTSMVATATGLFLNGDDITRGPELWALSADSSPDVNADGTVDIQDLAQLLSGFGTCSLDTNYTRTLDLDMDNCISLQDLAILLASFGN